MKARSIAVAGRRKLLGAAIVLTAATLVTVAALALAEGQKPYSLAGTYVEGCSCSLVCSCNLTGKFMGGCQGVGALSLTSGKFNGQDLAGAKIAAAMAPGSWVRLYVDAKNPKQKAAVSELASTAFGAYGKVESVKDAKVDLSGSDGKYTVTVDGGKVMKLSTEPFFGLDKKTPVSHSNVMDPFNPTIYQGTTVSCSYQDEAHSFTLEGSNSYFNPNMKSEGKL